MIAKYLIERERILDEETAQVWAENFLENSHERSGLLVEANPGVYAFLHKGFMEYLAAGALVNQSKTLVQTILANVTDEWWEQVILLAGAHPKLPEDYRAELVDRILKAAQEYPFNSVEHIRRLVMVGRLARDMAEYLPGQQHEQVETILYATATQSMLQPAHRVSAADALDELGWLPPDLHVFVPIPNATSYGFWIGKYPVTNIQYKRFLDDPEFSDKRYWVDFPMFDDNGILMKKTLGDEGWQWLLKSINVGSNSSNNKRLLPRKWNNAHFGISRKCVPVVTISWYEANAYCRWLKEHWSELDEGRINPDLQPGMVRLSIEEEWIAAAGGTEPKRRFPWDSYGNVMERANDIIKCGNIDESKIYRTTPVWMFPLGQNSLGVSDLGGNIWEWQANIFDKGHNYPALRGGSWFDNERKARVSARHEYIPYNGYDSVGFRVVAFPK